MAIKTTGVDHIHVLVPSLDRFLELFDRLFESEHTMQSEIESVQGFNSTLALPRCDINAVPGRLRAGNRGWNRRA